MKTLLLVSLATLSLASCVKVEKKATQQISQDKWKVTHEQIKNMFTRTGQKCLFTGDRESKDILLEKIESEGKTTYRLYEYRSADKVSLIGASFEGMGLISFTMGKNSQAFNGDQELVGSAPVTSPQLETDSDKPIVLSEGKLTLKISGQEMEGFLELITKRMNSEKVLVSETYMVATITNCDPATASF